MLGPPSFLIGFSRLKALEDSLLKGTTETTKRLYYYYLDERRRSREGGGGGGGGGGVDDDDSLFLSGRGGTLFCRA